jgi:hypothetical protein
MIAGNLYFYIFKILVIVQKNIITEFNGRVCL